MAQHIICGHLPNVQALPGRSHRLTPTKPAQASSCHSRRQICASRLVAKAGLAAEVAEEVKDSPAEGSEAEAVLPSPAAEAVDETSSAVSKRPSAIKGGFMTSYLWMDSNIAVCVDQIFSEGQRSPLTEYYFWPNGDAWEKLKESLDGKSWIKEADKNELLNTTTTVIEYWQDEPRHPIEDARAQFPDCHFHGY